MAGSTGVQTFSRISHNTRLSASAMKKESAAAAARSNSGDSSSCLTGNSPRSSNESPSSGGRAKRERSPERLESSGKGGPLLKGKRRFVGVRQRPSGRWVSEIKDTTQKIRLWLGTFDTAEDAARAYDEAAWLIRGANTRTNFVVAPSKVDNSALPSKAARLLLMRKNAIAAAAAAKPGSEDYNTSKQSQPQPKIQSLSESLLARASASAEPQHAMSIHFRPPAAASMPGPKSFQQQQNEPYSTASVMSTPPCSSVLSASSSYNRRDVGCDSNRSASHHRGGRVFKTSMDLKSVKLERSPLVTLDTGMVVEERSEVEMKLRAGLSSGNNSCREFSMGEEMRSIEVGMHRSSAANRDGESKSYNKCSDGVRENSRTNNSASAGFPVQQGATTAQDHIDSSTPLGQQKSFDTDISALSGLEDIDIGCVDSDFDFSAEMSMACGDHETGRINLESLFNGNTPTFSSTASGNGCGAGSSSEAATAYGGAYEDPDIFSEQMRQMMFGRQRSAGLYAMNGVQECLMLYNNSTPAPYCMSSPSLSLPPSFAKSHLPFKNSSLMSHGWIQHPHLNQEAGQFTSNLGGNNVSMHSNIYSESGAFSSNQQSDYRTTSNNVVAEQLSHGSSELSQQFTMGPEGPSPEALWNSYDIPPLCPVT